MARIASGRTDYLGDDEWQHHAEDDQEQSEPRVAWTERLRGDARTDTAIKSRAVPMNSANARRMSRFGSIAVRDNPRVSAWCKA
jgi:hypothetical protein